MVTFTQYHLPHGRKSDEEIERPKEIEDLAQRFIDSGGQYECEVLTTGYVSLTAVKDDDDVCIVISTNGPQIPDKVDELVRQSQQFLGTA